MIPMITLYEGNIENTRRGRNIAITQFFDDIKNGTWKEKIDRIRAIKDHKERRELKAEILPYVTVSGTFSYRNEKGLESYSKYMALDIDYVGEGNMDTVLSSLKSDPYTFAVFKSASGNGYCLVIKVTDREFHLNHFTWAEEYFLGTHGISIDKPCKDVTRARFVSYDPDIYIATNSKIAGKKRPPSKKKSGSVTYTQPMLSTDTQIGRLVSEIAGNGINIAEDHNDWRNIGFALSSELGESGRDYFHAVSAVSSKYDYKENDDFYSYVLSRSDTGITIGTFLNMCKENGLELYTAEEKRAYAFAMNIKKSGAPKNEVVNAAKNISIDAKIVEEVSTQVYDRGAYIDSSNDSIISKIAVFIQSNADIKRNSFTDMIECNGELVSDLFVNSLYNKACLSIGDKVTKSDIKSIIESDFTPSFCPIKNFLEEHKDLPQKPEIIDQLLDTIPYERPESRVFVRRWLMGIPATFNGEVVRLVLALCGKQETGKTYWFRHLLPDDLQKYFSDSFDLTKSFDTAIAMSSNLIAIDEEEQGANKMDVGAYKRLTSAREFDIILKYANYMKRLPRRAMLGITLNRTDFLKDETGNTRFLPVEFNKEYDWDLYNSIDKTQLFIEIFRAYERGESWKFDPKSKDILNKMNFVYEADNPEADLIDQFTTSAPDISKEYLKTTTEIFNHIVAHSAIKGLSMRKLTPILKQRYKWMHTTVNGRNKKGFICRLKNVNGGVIA